VKERKRERERVFKTRATFFSFFEEEKKEEEVNSFLFVVANASKSQKKKNENPLKRGRRVNECITYFS